MWIAAALRHGASFAPHPPAIPGAPLRGHPGYAWQADHRDGRAGPPRSL